MKPLSSALRDRLHAVRLLCLDMDGVLTDGHLYWSPGGIWSQRFSVQDGYGIKLLRDYGVEVAILSAGDVQSGRDRAASLGLKHTHFGVTDKLAAFRDVCGSLSLGPSACAFIGDELMDIPLLELVGFAATVPHAPREVKSVVHYVTERSGGDGAVRELCDLIRCRAA